jgi:hypothetical protein
LTALQGGFFLPPDLAIVYQQEYRVRKVVAHFNEFAINQAQDSSSLYLLFSPFTAFSNHCFAPSLETFPGLEISFRTFFNKFLIWIASLQHNQYWKHAKHRSVIFEFYSPISLPLLDLYGRKLVEI